MANDFDTLCQFDSDWKSHCHLDVTKIGSINILSKLDFCAQPPLLNVVLKIQRHAWKMTFLQGNGRESRTVGLEYFPLRLHVDFQKMSSISYHVECCLEALKTNGLQCYTNSTIVQNDHRPDPCQSYSMSSSWNLSLVGLCLLVLFSLVTIIVAGFVVFKRIRTLKRLAARRRPFVVPKLPRAKGYEMFAEENVGKQRAEHVPIVTPTCIPEETSEQLADEIRRKSTTSWRESKFVQTSCNSLDTEILLLTNTSSGGSSSSSSRDGRIRGDVGGRTSKEPTAESPL